MELISQSEKQINEYKYFFKKYLSKVKNYPKALQDVSESLNLLIANPIHGAMQTTMDRHVKIAVKIENCLKSHFGEELLKLYYKKVEARPSKRHDKIVSDAMDTNILLGILVALGSGFQEMSEQAKSQYAYQKNVLAFTYNCLLQHGLHPNISLRNELKHKRFNLLIKHKTHSRTPIEDHKVLIPWETFHSDYLAYYKSKKPIRIGGKLIDFKKIIELKITTTLLHDDEIEFFARQNNFAWSSSNKNTMGLLNICNDETERFHPNPFEAEVKAKTSDRYQETRVSLIDYPDALKLFNDALKKINIPESHRNCLDDLRLCLELLLKSKLKNSKSIENQTAPLGKYLKEKGGSSEMNNLFHKILEFYGNYQNSHIKHNDAVKPNEVKLIINLSSDLIVHISSL